MLLRPFMRSSQSTLSNDTINHDLHVDTDKVARSRRATSRFAFLTSVRAFNLFERARTAQSLKQICLMPRVRRLFCIVGFNGYCQNVRSFQQMETLVLRTSTSPKMDCDKKRLRADRHVDLSRGQDGQPQCLLRSQAVVFAFSRVTSMNKCVIILN